ncbi:MAG: hypothetical protein A2Y12_17905 [Planctomycetes bacterium GWF2_42_9]|nr:MAG: hypothetical protein A2Y12_17905 [Planctomycetes bacterium GWF2_42_9]
MLGKSTMSKLLFCCCMISAICRGNEIIHYDFDAGSGTIVDDSVASNDGSLCSFAFDGVSDWSINHPMPVDGSGFNYVGNNSLSFDKNNTAMNYLYIPGSAALKPTSAVTYQFWIKDDIQPSIGDASFSYLGGQLESFYMERYFNGSNYLRYRIGLKNSGFGGSWWAWPIYTDVIVPVDGQWHNVAFTYDASTKHAIGYIDGQISLDNDLAIAGLSNYTLASDGAVNGILFGIAPQNGFRRASFLMDEFAMYNEALLGNAIANNMLNIPEPSCILLLAAGIALTRNKFSKKA